MRRTFVIEIYIPPSGNRPSDYYVHPWNYRMEKAKWKKKLLPGEYKSVNEAQEAIARLRVVEEILER